MADNVVQLKRRPRPLRKTYDPKAPYEVEREDTDTSIDYHVVDVRPDSYRTVITFHDWEAQIDPWAKHDAEQVVRGLNLLVQYGMEKLPKVKDDFLDLGAEDDNG
jgi:hypothetical protein